MLNFSLKKLNRSTFTFSLTATFVFVLFFILAEPLFLSAQESQLRISLTVIEEISSAKNRAILPTIEKHFLNQTEGEISVVLTGY